MRIRGTIRLALKERRISVCRRKLVAVDAEATMAKPRASRRKWVRTVKTDSTHPPRGTFSGSAADIARTMARKDVSPGGTGSAIRMIQYFINRGGKKLSPARRTELERAKRILQRRIGRRKRAGTKKR